MVRATYPYCNHKQCAVRILLIPVNGMMDFLTSRIRYDPLVVNRHLCRSAVAQVSADRNYEKGLEFNQVATP